MSTGRRWLSFTLKACFLTIFIFIGFPPAQIAQAHANLVRSYPENGANLDRAPKTAELEFSEDLDPALSKARLVDANLAILDEGPGIIDPNNPRILRLDLPALSTSEYNILWEVRSATDGHITSGIVSFSIGKAATNFSLLPPPGTPDPTSTRPPLADTLIRWLSYIAVAMAAGSLIFGVLVWRPAYRGWKALDSLSDQEAWRRLIRIAQIGIISLAVLTLAFLLYQAWQATQGIIRLAYGQTLLALVGSYSGWIFWLRMLLLGLLLVLVRHLPPSGEGSSLPWWEAILAALAVLMTFSLQSHAVALNNPLAVGMDWMHITAMAAWMGGLLCLFYLLRNTGLPGRLLVPKFSRLAIVSVVALAASGLYSAFYEVGSIQALISTIYGKAIMVKSALFAILVGLGAINLLVLSPRLSRPEGEPHQRMRITIRVELTIGLIVVAAAGVMAGVSPALQALLARQRLGYIGEYREHGVRIDLWVMPQQVGDNEIAVDVIGLPTGGGEPEPQLLLRLQAVDANLGINQMEAKPINSARYSLRGSFLNVSGNWQVEVILRRAGMDDIRHVFDLPIQPNSNFVDLLNPIPVSEAAIHAGKLIYESDCLPCHGPQGKGDGPAGLVMRPPPADLSIHTRPGVHPDGQLFEWIANGYPGSAMPAFRNSLSDEQLWDLVIYIRTLASK